MPEPLQSRTEPKGLIPGAKERIRVHAEKDCPYFSSVGKGWITADGPCQVSIYVEPEGQHNIHTEARRNQRLQERRMAPGPLQASRRDYQAAERQANARGGAVRENQQPERHCAKNYVHTDDRSRAWLLALGPARQRVPEEIDATHQANQTEHVFARRRSDVHVSPCPYRVLFADLGVVLDQ